MSKFEVGQKVVAIENHSMWFYQKGEEYTVTSVNKSLCGCDKWVINIGKKSFGTSSCCRNCGGTSTENLTEIGFDEKGFELIKEA